MPDTKQHRSLWHTVLKCRHQVASRLQPNMWPFSMMLIITSEATGGRRNEGDRTADGK